MKNMLRKFTIVCGAIILAVSATGCFTEDVALINLGDSLTNGVQSNSVNEFTQTKGYTELLNRQIALATECTWNNPLLDVSGPRKDATVTPYNVAVSGATVKSLLEEKTNSTNPLLTELLKPLPALAGSDLTQLEAALYLAKINPDKKKVITLWIGNNDVLGAVTNDGASQLSADQINAFLSDSTSGRDLCSMLKNISKIICQLSSLQNTEVYVATLPYVTSTAYLFNEKDIEHMAAFTGADVTVMESNSAIGFGPFLNPADPANSIARTLNPYSDNTYLNYAVQATIAQEQFVLSQSEAKIINDRITAINSFIMLLSKRFHSVSVVDINSTFKKIAENGLAVDGKLLTRSFGGGIFSLDGIHPSDTGYAIIANEFIKAINKHNNDKIQEINLADINKTDPYYDNDGDGYVPGPADLLSIDSFLAQLADSNDADASIIAPYINPAQKANLPLAPDDITKINGVKVSGNRVIFVYDETIHGGVTGPANYVRATFNGWTKNNAFMLIPSATPGVWFLEKTVADINIPGNSGQPEFKFHVGGQWLNALPEVQPGFKFQTNHLIIFPGDDTSVIAANEDLANRIKPLSEFDLTKLEDRQMISNFRLVPGTTKLYRSYHPYKKSRPALDTEDTRIAIVNEMLELYGVKSVVTLAANGTAPDYVMEPVDPALGEVILPYLQNIITNKNDYITNTDYNTVFFYSNTPAFGNLIRDVVTFINTSTNDSPFMVHCRLGTDRTGVTCAVLAALAGTPWNDICTDFQKSNNMGVGEFRDYKLLRYSFQHMLGINIDSNTNLQQVMTDYFINNGYLTQAQIDSLKLKIK